ncbi:MAG: DcrB-related protein [Candidatus Magasanikbacteria bacterium]
MKKNLFIISIVLLFAGAGCSFGSDPEKSTAVTSNTHLEIDSPTSPKPTSVPATDSGTYTNSQFNFSITPPESWEKKEGFFGSIVAFFSPLSSEADDFSENVNAVVGNLEGVKITLSEYADLNIKQLEAAIEGFSLTKKEQIKVGNLDAMETAYSGTMQGESLSWTQWYIIDGSNAFVITYTGRGDDYEAFLKEGKGIVQTFIIN